MTPSPSPSASGPLCCTRLSLLSMCLSGACHWAIQDGHGLISRVLLTFSKTSFELRSRSQALMIRTWMCSLRDTIQLTTKDVSDKGDKERNPTWTCTRELRPVSVTNRECPFFSVTVTGVVSVSTTGSVTEAAMN